MSHKGWICPKCGAVLAPWISECPHCSPIAVPTIPHIPEPPHPRVPVKDPWEDDWKPWKKPKPDDDWIRKYRKIYPKILETSSSSFDTEFGFPIQATRHGYIFS